MEHAEPSYSIAAASENPSHCKRLLRLVLRGLKSLLTIAATPFSHTDVIASGKKAKNLETDVEYLPRLRRWAGNLTTKPGKLRSFYTRS